MVNIVHNTPVSIILTASIVACMSADTVKKALAAARAISRCLRVFLVIPPGIFGGGQRECMWWCVGVLRFRGRWLMEDEEALLKACMCRKQK